MTNILIITTYLPIISQSQNVGLQYFYTVENIPANEIFICDARDSKAYFNIHTIPIIIIKNINILYYMLVIIFIVHNNYTIWIY